MDELILDFSGMYAEEEFLPSSAKYFDFKSLEGTNCYCDQGAASVLRSALKDCSYKGLHWIDTGDYHYCSLFFLEKIGFQCSLALFDNHSDDFESPVLSCGSWVRTYLQDFNGSLFTGGSGSKVYLSIDKDVLSRDYARTNWDQGSMTLPELLDRISCIADSNEIIGIDVCGGICSSKGACAEDYGINRKTDEILRDFLLHLKSDKY